MMNLRNLSKVTPRSPSRLVSCSAGRFEKLSSHTNPTEPINEPVKAAKISDFDKKILVWTKKYKSLDEIPDKVSHETLHRARTDFRIKVCNWMLIATVVGCGLMIYSGKRAAERGESVQRMNQEWHQQLNNESAAKHGQNK